MSCSRSYIVLKGRQNLLILINILFLSDLDDFLDFFQSEILKPLNQPIKGGGRGDQDGEHMETHGCFISMYDKIHYK